MKGLQPHERIILAYDKSTATDDDFALLRRLNGVVGGVKLGLETISAVTPGNSIPMYFRLLPILRQCGFFVMADWKLKDIPNTVGKTTANIAAHGVWGMTMHADADLAAIGAAVANRGNMNVIGVTVLTSLSPERCKAVNGRLPVGQVGYLVDLLLQEQAQAVVCSPLELDCVRMSSGDNLIRITPGIRAKNTKPDDQNRTMTAADAVSAGADYLVIGRPIMQADDPVAAAKAIGDEIAAAEANLSMV